MRHGVGVRPVGRAAALCDRARLARPLVRRAWRLEGERFKVRGANAAAARVIAAVAGTAAAAAAGTAVASAAAAAAAAVVVVVVVEALTLA